MRHGVNTASTRKDVRAVVAFSRRAGRGRHHDEAKHKLPGDVEARHPQSRDPHAGHGLQSRGVYPGRSVSDQTALSVHRHRGDGLMDTRADSAIAYCSALGKDPDEVVFGYIPLDDVWVWTGQPRFVWYLGAHPGLAFGAMGLSPRQRALRR